MPQYFDRLPGIRFLTRLSKQLVAINPFGGDYKPTRVPLLLPFGRPTLPFPHPWNFQRPIDILNAYFWRADEETGPGRHNRYLTYPAFRPCTSPATRVSSAPFSRPRAIAKDSSIATRCPQQELRGRQEKTPCFSAMDRCGDDNER